MAAITASVIPAVSAALARRDRRGAARITGSALRITALLAFPMGVGLFVLGTAHHATDLSRAERRSVAGPLLSTLGLATVFVCMMLVCNSILQAHGFVNLPVVIMVLGGVVKIVTNYNLVARAHHRHLRRTGGQYSVLRPVHGAGLGGHRPGHPQPAPDYLPLSCQAGWPRRP